MGEDGVLYLETASDRLGFDSTTGSLVSLVAKAAPEQEFIARGQYPAFVIGYLDDLRQYRLLPSSEAQDIQVQRRTGGGEQVLTAYYSRVAGHDLDVAFEVYTGSDAPASRWSIHVRNEAGLPIVDVQFPFVICAYDLGGTPGSEAVLLPHGIGKLLRPSGDHGSRETWRLDPDSWQAWELTSLNGDFDHYPGTQFAQFMAYYNDRAGLYLACDDTRANVKRFRALHRVGGVRLGVAHIGDWPTQGGRQLEYDTLLTSFSGDWYDAAEIYRAWTLEQSWAVPLSRRQDVPDWLLDSPAYITIRPQGILDDGPVFPVEAFLPYEEKCLPLLDRLARRLDAPLVTVLMGWERAASWVYPDCFPPVGGDESMTRFGRLSRERGWHTGSFCNGTRWVTGHLWNGYDGRDYFREHCGEQGVCREADGSLWRENWDPKWRPSYATCLGAEQTRQIAVDFVKRLIGWGMESIQFFDQNCGAATFACFAPEHGHPAMPGKWMAAAMTQIIDEYKAVAHTAGERGVINSAESGVNEWCLPLFQETDMRVTPPGHQRDFVPLYHYLFHECIIIQGMMGNAPEPYHLPLRNAANCIYGQIPGAVMMGDGALLNRDTGNWAPWEPKVGSDDDAVEMIRTVTALRRGAGRDFLVYGRMLRPAQVSGIEDITWTYEGRDHCIPAIFHAAWQAPDGRAGVVLANWTTTKRRVVIHDSRLGPAPVVHSGGSMAPEAVQPNDSGGFAVTVPPLGCVLVEAI
jgi:hypothetical protein